MDEAKYSIHNERTVQGQVTGEHITVHQHFHSTRADALQPSAPERIWTVPYHRNPFFTGREDRLKQLHDRLTSTRVAALTQAQAISGLGGIGKTQMAVEYAYRHKSDYQHTLWISAASPDTLVGEFVTLAGILNLSEKNEQNQNITVAAVKRWLEQHDQWLLILDNADDLEMAADFLPTGSNGYILLTTRTQATGALANSLEVEEMDKQEGTLLLLRRAKRLARDALLDQISEADRTNAEAIVMEMDGLPLALDQAGAYIEETSCNLASYLEQYRQRQATFLQRRGTSKDHPDSVATTWSLSFERVEQLNRMAADLLRLCAFLAPDSIPEDMILKGASKLGPQFQPMIDDASLLDEAIATLRRFSLVRRNQDDHTLSIHRLVQAVLKANIDKQTQRQWAERTVRAVNHVFPRVEFTKWPQCERYFPHVQACADLIEQHALSFPEAARLLNRAAFYLYDRARYVQAEPLYQRALAISEKELGATHPETATGLNNLALLYMDRGRYGEAELLCQRALAIRETELGATHPDTAESLNNLAVLYKSQGRYGEAELLCQRALAIRETELGATHPDTAESLNNLAGLYMDQGRYGEAELLYQRALAISEKELGAMHPYTATGLNNLALLYERQGRYGEAERLLKRALAICEQVLGPEYPNTRTVRKNYAGLLKDMKRKRKR